MAFATAGLRRVLPTGRTLTRRFAGPNSTSRFCTATPLPAPPPTGPPPTGPFGGAQTFAQQEAHPAAAGASANLASYHQVLQAWATKPNAGLKAEEWLGKMIEAGVAPTGNSYTLVMKSYSKEGKVDDCRRLIAAMSERGLQPTVATYTTLASAYTTKGDIRGASQVLDEMRENGILPNYVSYAVLIEAWSKKGDFRQAEGLLQDLEDGNADRSQPVASPYSCLMSNYLRANQFQDAERIWHQMIQQGVRPDVTSYTIYIQLLLQRDDTQGAQEALSQMQASNLKPNCITFAAFLAKAAKDGSVVDCQQYWDQMEALRVKPNVACYNSMIKAYAKAGLMDVAESWMDKVNALGKGPNMFTYGTLMDGYASIGDASKCVAIFEQMRARNIPENTVHRNTIIKAYVVVQDFDKALEQIQDMGKNPNTQPDQYSFAPIIHGLVKAGQIDRAESLLTTMRQHDVEPDSRLLFAVDHAKTAQQRTASLTESDHDAPASSAGTMQEPEPTGVDWVEVPQQDGSRLFRPSAGGPLTAEPPARGVVQLMSPSGPYYWHVESNTTSWERPTSV
mmetsp:Transcript_70608/g.147893  ORF Transcript_70608/g.147893 Transcript_70608/m.147893 type:complete len:564 (-) Transcript_70608:41-1732(-)